MENEILTGFLRCTSPYSTSKDTISVLGCKIHTKGTTNGNVLGQLSTKRIKHKHLIGEFELRDDLHPLDNAVVYIYELGKQRKNARYVIANDKSGNYIGDIQVTPGVSIHKGILIAGAVCIVAAMSALLLIGAGDSKNIDSVQLPDSGIEMADPGKLKTATTEEIRAALQKQVDYRHMNISINAHPTNKGGGDYNVAITNTERNQHAFQVEIVTDQDQQLVWKSPIFTPNTNLENALIPSLPAGDHPATAYFRAYEMGEDGQPTDNYLGVSFAFITLHN